MRTLRIFALLFILLLSNKLSAQSSFCQDLSGLDFGECLSILGYGMIDGECTPISGCSTEIDGFDYQNYLFESPEACEAFCNATCLNFDFLDFGPCEAILGYGMINGECSAISGCSTIINGFDFSPYLYSNPIACQLACNPICMDLYGIDFGLCDMFMGYAYINGEIVALSGCGSVVDGVDYSAFIYESEVQCAANCQNACLDLSNLDFGICAMPLGIAIIDGECTMLSGCSYEINGVSYESYFFSSMEDCESGCLPANSPCVIPELIDSSAACYEIFAPVCGCDNVTYPNDCYARTYGGVLYWTPGSCTTGIESFQNSLVKFYPNPATDFLYIENPEAEEFSFQLIDMRGKIVLRFNNNTSKMIDISYINQGIYLLYIQNNKGEISVNKLIIK
jgi:hypothetical protein